MAGRIPKDFIDQLLTRIDIIDVIHARVPLKKQGREYMACCPFHSEKTPSFTVSPTKQFYHCFGCGEHGSAISFLMSYDNLEYVEAIETLAHQLGLVIPYEQADNKKSTARITKTKTNLDTYQLMEQVASFYQNQLKQSESAQTYLSQRGVSDEISLRFQLGYAPDGWDVLSQAFPKQGSGLLEGGVQIKNDTGRCYDRFRGRLIFPIRDRRGRVIGFGGRVLGEGSPKYLNSPETPLFHKGRELYGFYEARQHTRQLERLLVVEGYMDVIALAQFGIHYAVATLGTATTPEHVKRLFKTVREVVFCFDGDRAGKQAAWRALETCLPELRDDREVRFLFLPQDEDPDSLVRRIGPVAFEALYPDALTLSDYLLVGLKQQFNIGQREGRTRLLDAALTLLETMPELLLKEQLFVALAQLTGLDVAIIRKRRQSRQSMPSTPPASKSPTRSPKTLTIQPNEHRIQRTPLRLVIATLLQAPHLVQYIDNPEQLIKFPIPEVDLLLSIVDIIETNPHINTASIVERLRDETHNELIHLLLSSLSYQVAPEVMESEFKDSLRQFLRQGIQLRIDHLVHIAQNRELTLQEKYDLKLLIEEDHRLNSR